MPTTAAAPALLRQVCPSALVVPSRILRRVIKKHRRLGGLGLGVPHRQSYRIDREALLAIASLGELGLESADAVPQVALLLHEVEASLAREQQLVAYWRLLFHAEVHQALDRLGAELTEEALRERVARLGPVAFEEVRDVLRQENLLFRPDDPAEVYKELAAVYLELRFFDTHRLGQYFPALDAPTAEAVLLADVSAEAIYHATRPPGAPEPGSVLAPEPEAPTEPPSPERTTTTPGTIRVQAEQVSRAGNQVRAALLLERAVAVSPGPQAGALHAAARQEIEALTVRLGTALHLPQAERADWVECLLALLPAASATRLWSVEARLLYDLQKVCTDVERPVYTADLVEWALSMFRRPIKRPLPDQPLVLVVKHLRGALIRLPAARMPAAPRQRLGELLRDALHAAEGRLRATIGPKLAAALERVGLAPRSVAERLSRDRLVEELLDTIGTRGRISIGDLRDAIARSRLKLPDLTGPIELARGDALLRANAELAVTLDGIYRGGEIYLRWLQSLGSVFFGTVVGRILTLYLILPLLGSLMLLMGLDEVFHLGESFLGGPHVKTFNLWSFAIVAALLVPMIHAPPFRRAVFRGLWFVWLALRGLLVDLPLAVVRLPLVRAILQSKPYLLFWHFVGKPLLWVLPVALVLWLCGVGWEVNAIASGCLLLAASAVGNTRAGVVIEETTTDWIVRTGQLIREDLVPGLLRFIQWLSRTVFDRIERALYTVDEALRFRQGEGRVAFVAKLLLGLVWFLFTWLFRLIYNVFFEPQVNPIKHFPVVTVAHKVTIAAIPPAVAALEGLGWSRPRAVALVTGLQAATPGMWGFLAWELKENWRLYRANAPEAIGPAIVGSHGEWIINLVRPGFHSGTLPKLYARLRRARGAGERKCEEGLHHVEEEVTRFVERDLIAVLKASRRWPEAAALTVGHVHPATNRVQIELLCPSLGPGPLVIEWANRAGWLAARLPAVGWLGAVSEDGRAAFRSALVWLYKRAGVDLVEEHLQAIFPSRAEWAIDRDHLTISLDQGRTGAYNLRQPDHPVEWTGGAPAVLPQSAGPLLFSSSPLSWSAWVALWEEDAAGKPHDPPLLPPFTLLPPLVRAEN